MSHILLLTNSTGTSVDVLPALELLNHRVHILPAEPTALLETDPCDIVLLDARKDLVGARSLTQLLKATGLSAPLMLILTEGGMAAVSSAWAVDDILLESAGPGRGRGPDPPRRGTGGSRAGGGPDRNPGRRRRD